MKDYLVCMISATILYLLIQPSDISMFEIAIFMMCTNMILSKNEKEKAG